MWPTQLIRKSLVAVAIVSAVLLVYITLQMVATKRETGLVEKELKQKPLQVTQVGYKTQPILLRTYDTPMWGDNTPITKEAVMTTEERSKFQQAQVDKFCERYNLTHRKLVLPNKRHLVYTQLLLHKEAEVLYCAPPKTGCTNLKTAFFINQGKIDPSVLDGEGGLDLKIQRTVNSNTIQVLNDTQQNEALHNYYKYTMYRHPLERLASGYRDKVRNFPLQGLEKWTPLYNWVNMETYKYTHPDEYKKWFAEGGRRVVDISFPDFVAYWLKTTARHDVHFEPITGLCAPCIVRYDYYGNFHTFNRDARVLLDRIHANSSFLREDYYNGSDYTAMVAKKLFDQVSLEQKLAVLKKLSREIDFYYHLFPEERDSHKRILDTDAELPVPYHT